MRNVLLLVKELNRVGKTRRKMLVQQDRRVVIEKELCLAPNQGVLLLLAETKLLRQGDTEAQD